ncbi:broad-spectrum mercury transporter MerE [Sphingopyxis sp. SE2]|nr:broad-spectrum mercury transporter MerE [Sphingopyxis sp. SE2]MDT7531469.1 broad-spectrum mercury transporter MerE [Sphingopyxis sp. SE2]
MRSLGSSRPSRTRAFIWSALAALTCPCHLPLLLTLFAGSSFAAILGENWNIALVVLTGLFLLFLSGALQAFRAKS